MVHTKERWHDRIPFFCQKTVFLYFENIISPSQRTSQCRNWVTSSLAAKISCCLTRYSFVFMLNRSPNSFYMYIRVNNLAIVLASKNNTIAKHQIYLPRNSEYSFLGYDVYIRHFIYIFFIYYQVVYLCYISLRDRIFILFLFMTWPE